MEDRSWILPALIMLIVAVPLVVFVSHMVNDRLKARRNLRYKTIEDHQILNASSREEWMKGALAPPDEEPLSRFASIFGPLAQLATVLILAVALIVWNQSLVRENAREDDRLTKLELQLHALALAPNQPAAAAQVDTADGAIAPGAVFSGANPMQQACANLIGRVADAYEKGASSKTAQSLEELVKKLGCANNPAP